MPKDNKAEQAPIYSWLKDWNSKPVSHVIYQGRKGYG